MLNQERAAPAQQSLVFEDQVGKPPPFPLPGFLTSATAPSLWPAVTMSENSVSDVDPDDLAEMMKGIDDLDDDLFGKKSKD